MSKYIAINHNGRIVGGPLASFIKCSRIAEDYMWATENRAFVITVAQAPQHMNEGQMREAGIE